MYRIPYFAAALILLCTNMVYSQQRQLNQITIKADVKIIQQQFLAKHHKQLLLTSATIPFNYYSKHTGFFCKQEMKIEKAFAIPIKLRLGSVAYCNYLEQKPGYINFEK